MSAIDLLLRSGRDLERVHQLLISVLLEQSRFGVVLGISELPAEVTWEPYGGIFDLSAKSPRGTSWIELKVMSSAHRHQLGRQADWLEKRRKDGVHEGVYITLGASAYEFSDDCICEQLRGPARRITTDQVVDALQQLCTDAPPDVQDLARSYACSLQDWISWRDRALPADLSDWCHFSHYEFFRRIQHALSAHRKSQIYTVQNAGSANHLLNVAPWQQIYGGAAEVYVELQNGACLLKVYVKAPEARRRIRHALLERMLPHLGRIPAAVKPFGKLGAYMSVYRVEEDLRKRADPLRASVVLLAAQDAIESLGCELCNEALP